jgi:hypothetical protein
MSLMKTEQMLEDIDLDLADPFGNVASASSNMVVPDEYECLMWSVFGEPHLTQISSSTPLATPA